MDDLTGHRLNDHQLLRRLGQGAMASVYLAEQRSLSRRVAVKVLSAELGRDAAAVDRFQHEARAAASLVHPGIVQVYEVGSADVQGEQRHYLAQEYVPGGTLGRLLGRERTLSPGRVLRVLGEVGAALAAAGQRGVVHRDIKPDNLMVDQSGSIKVADFGLARLAESDATRLTQAGVALGTPLYMSPEQVEGRAVDSRSDLYSLGVTAYHLLTGDPPFTGDTPLSVAVQHLNNQPPAVTSRRADTPPALAEVIDRLLAKDPADRYSSPEELLDTLGLVAASAEMDGWAEPGASGFGAFASGSLAVDRSLPSGDAVARLSAAMQAQSASDRGAGSTGRRRRWFGVVAVLIGLVMGAAMVRSQRPTMRWRGDATPRLENVKQQLYHAKSIDTPDAWRSVVEMHPDADRYFHALALRGAALAELREGADRRALATLREADRVRGADASPDVVSEAARLIAATRVGDDEAARLARAAIDAAPRSSRAALDALPAAFSDAYSAARERVDGR